MADESKSPKKGSITEEDAAALLERYSVETLLTLLQEVERVAGDKMDWDELVKNTATGISCAREYQMLWRHLAYGNMLEDQIDSDAEPMDDDSDLEFDMKASPAATNEESALAEACVKVLIASGSNNSNPPDDSTIDAPLTINVRSSKAPPASSDSSLLADAIQGTNVTIPVSVQKSTGGLTPSRRRDWSKEEDMKLTASVQKYGEPDWANIAEGDFENGRSASELSKRWTELTKKLDSSNAGSSSQLSEPKLAAAHGSLPMDNTLNVANEINTDSAKAAAIAAGAHMGASAEGSSLNDAARSQNVVRLKAAAGYVMRKYRARKYQLPSNVRSIRRGLAKAPISSYSAPVHSAARAVQPNPVEAAPVLSLSSEKTNSTASIPESEESGYQASISSSDPENHPLDAHVAMQISEDEELGDEDVEATSSNSIAPTKDDGE
ncbi:uncharacterized protein [Primulina huaijiensis]|uniref:uncharacterized protein isoform X2 n=1 Tax=Primulina huaijiensis TaxID=1492673 RepID=UPI003CC781F7